MHSQTGLPWVYEVVLLWVLWYSIGNMPLAQTLRPTTFSEFVGQSHLVGSGKPITRMVETGNISSMILWGPPGCGKTTIAQLLAHAVDATFIAFSAVTSGVADVRKIIADIEHKRNAHQLSLEESSPQTILFVDEIHRFNKAQQDAFLPHVESGTIILVGATTENPGFAVNAPLISRSRVYKLNPLTSQEMHTLIDRARALSPTITWDDDAIAFLVAYANGDARTAINAIELAVGIHTHITVPIIEEILQHKIPLYDKKGDAHYDTISAFIKSMRGSQPDATLHYLARMIRAGEDAVFIARRMVIFASEDIGNVQPTALVVATSTMHAVTMIGMPEAQLILAQTATYLATCKKSIASSDGLWKALHDVDTMSLDPVPLHLRNATNAVSKEHGYGAGHVRYPWMDTNGGDTQQEYMPANLVGKTYYRKPSH